jgi:hypothetical protein
MITSHPGHGIPYTQRSTIQYVESAPVGTPALSLEMS